MGMTTRRLELREWDERRVELSLDAAQLAALRAAHIDVTPHGGDCYALRPSSHIGVLAAGDLAVVVRPKIPIDRVMFLIAYALDIGDWRRDEATLDRDADVLEAIVPAFLHHTRRAIRRGLRQDYRIEEEALHAVRGRIRFGDQIRRRFGIPLPIEVGYDDFTEDIEENRLLHAAIHLLGRVPLRSQRWRRELRGLRPAFAAVGVGSYRRGDLSPEGALPPAQRALPPRRRAGAADHRIIELRTASRRGDRLRLPDRHERRV